MASPEAMLAFTLVSIPLILVPGPSVLFVIGRALSLIGRALSLNRIGALLSVVDTALGSLVAGLPVPFGVGLVVQQSVVLFTVLKVAGGLYLGVQAIRHRNPAADADARRIVVRSKLRLLREGFVMGVTHPKTVVFLIAVLHQFVDHGVGGVSAQMASLAAVFTAVAAVFTAVTAVFTAVAAVFTAVAAVLDSGWALAAGAARGWFARSPQWLSRLGATGGVLMIGIGATALFAGTGKD